MTHDQLRLAISACFRAFRACDKKEQAAVLAVVEFYKRTHRSTIKNWSAEMLANRLIKEAEGK